LWKAKITNSNNDLFSSELEKIYLLPKFKRKGFGTLALNQLIQFLVIRNKKVLYLDVLDSNISSINFYIKNGFEKFGVSRLTEPLLKEELKGMLVMKKHLD